MLRYRRAPDAPCYRNVYLHRHINCFLTALLSFRRITGCNDPIWLKLALSLAGLLSVANAQPADRIYPIMQLTDRDVAEIDVTDGSVEDWEYIVGEPTLTPLDFAETLWWLVRSF